MDASALREFLALSETLNYSATARMFFISQSALSKHMKLLEEEAGAALLLRNTHSTKLTPEGEIFAKHARRALEEIDVALDEIAQLRARNHISLSIGTMEVSAGATMAHALGLLNGRIANVDSSVATLEVEEVIKAVEEGSIDVGVTMLFETAIPDDIGLKCLAVENFGALVAKGHPLTRKKSVVALDLAPYRILIPSPSEFPTMSRITRSAISTVSRRMRIVDKMTNIGSIAPFLISEGGVALTFSNVSRYYRDCFPFIPLPDIEAHATVGVLWKGSRENAVIASFVDCMAEAVEKYGGIM